MDQNGIALWHELVDLVKPIVLTSSPDTPKWMIDASGLYTVKSFYEMINFGGMISPVNDACGKCCAPQRFMCFFGFWSITKF